MRESNPRARAISTIHGDDVRQSCPVTQSCHDVRDPMKQHTIETSIVLPGALAEVFPFFAAAENLEAITPPWLNFKILTPSPIRMEVGSLIDYQIKIRGVPVRWRTRIAVWEPPYRFVDEQIKGPYRRWWHEHTFEERPGQTGAGAAEVLAKDRVQYAVPGGPLEPIVHSLFVKNDVRRIFDYRQQTLRKLFVAGNSPGR
jgi:ligand-binding SRPBCC domain-containing protein